MNPRNVDVTIIGAGLVGLAAALALEQAGYAVVLVDSQRPSAQSDHNNHDWDQRIYAISPRNAAWLASLGAWQPLDVRRVAKIQAMEIFGDDASSKPLQLNAEDDHADALGFIVEERALKQALMQCLQKSGVRMMFGNACQNVQTSPQQATLQLADGQELVSRLLIAADGANSWVREQLGIGIQQKHYYQTAIVANFAVEKSHNNIARQWFTQDAAGRSSVLAWLPLPKNKISIVWSVPTQTADALLKLGDELLTQAVQAAGAQVLGDLTSITSPVAFPLTLKKADVLTYDCVVLMGDAAHRIHPMAGQGVNLGFRDVMDWMEVIGNKHQFQPINDATLLKQYTRMRKADMLKMLALTDGLYYLFENQNSVVKKVRNWGLSATNQQAIKKILVENAVSL